MYSTREARKMLVFLPSKQGGAKRYGKVLRVVFHPSRKQAVGILVKRPDALLMVKRKERFVAFDRLSRCEQGFEVVDQPDSWDARACKRLGIDYDRCILWDYQPCRTVDGRELGTVSDVVFDETSLLIDHIDVSEGGVDRAVLGSVVVPAGRIRGYDDGAIVVEEPRDEVPLSGGIASAAGEAWARAAHGASEKGAKAAAAAGKAVDKGAFALGRQLGRASRMFKDFKDEYDKASRS